MFNQGFTKFEMAMGLAVIAIAVLVMFPPLHGGMEQDRAVRAWENAESLAWAIQEYRDDTGKWPEVRAGKLDPSCLTGIDRRAPEHSPRAALAGASGPSNPAAILGTMSQPADPGPIDNGARPWLKEVPLDSWNRPFNIWVLGTPIDLDTKAVVVISCGPDGILQTDPMAWPPARVANAAALCRNGPALMPEGLFLGDDIGFILSGSTLGES